MASNPIDTVKLTHPTAEIFIPDGVPVEKALARTTHMGIGAHPDDLEFMALHGILECFQKTDQWFTGVTVTDGRGSARAGDYARYTDDEMRLVRRGEQKKAAMIGEYGAMICLDFPSAAIKKPDHREVIAELKTLIAAATPDVIYTHNPADKHDTHLAVLLPVLAAIRELPESQRPQALYGCEVWRNLDWLLDKEKVTLNVSGRENLAMSLMGVFDSQIAGGKRYDLATQGRKRANATYFESHATDKTTALEFAMNLTPLVKDPSLDIRRYVAGFITRFADDVNVRLSKFLPH